MEKTISQISRMMAPVLNDAQLSELNDVLYACLCGKGRHLERGKNAKEHLRDFLAAKKLEGCSDRSIRYTQAFWGRFITEVNKSINEVSTDDVRGILRNIRNLMGPGKLQSII